MVVVFDESPPYSRSLCDDAGGRDSVAARQYAWRDSPKATNRGRESALLQGALEGYGKSNQDCRACAGGQTMPCSNDNEQHLRELTDTGDGPQQGHRGLGRWSRGCAVVYHPVQSALTSLDAQRR